MPLPARYNDAYRARHRTAAEIRVGVSTRLIAWPGTGFQTESEGTGTFARVPFGRLDG